jgi:hypothetical protein
MVSSFLQWLACLSLDTPDSDVIHIKVLGQHMICLNSAQAAIDLLDRRGANYCDRPRFTLFEV